ncbi:NSUN4-like protein, partial [Mya arenaria]
DEDYLASAETISKFNNCDRALENFDLYYKPVYGERWPSIRISLLTAKKSCVIINNFVTENEYGDTFSDLGAVDILELARKRQTAYANKMNKTNIKQSSLDQADVLRNVSSDQYASQEDNYSNVSEEQNPVYDSIISETDRKNLDLFMPAQVVYSDHMEQRIEEVRQSIYTPQDVKVDIVQPAPVSLSVDLTALAFPPGDVNMFPEPKTQNRHFMLDASSILPVLALDLHAGNRLLDLCAAPGGKGLAALQTLKPDQVLCNDISKSRLNRLKSIMRLYVPDEHRVRIKTTLRDGQKFTQQEFDKVLVDVPCNTDRHSVLDGGRNLFSPARIQERIGLPKLQTELLLSGLQCVKVGGCVVYSTCTLSPAQNDGIVQSALDRLWRETNISVEIEDLAEFRHIFSDTLSFYDSCRFGQLVIPSLSKNFGPMYFCRIRRIS